MAISPTGPLAAPLAALRQMIAASAAFQAWVGVTGQPDALARSLERVHLLTNPSDADRPFAIIDFVDLARERDRVINGRTFQLRSGSGLVVWFRADAGAGLDEPDASVDYCNRLGAVWEDLERAAGVTTDPTNPTALAINLIELAISPTRVEVEKRRRSGDYFEAALTVSMTRRAA
jgi:hypothetical protein